MFHKTSIKLAGFYLAIIMTISLFFSASLYNLSMREIRRGFTRQSQVLEPVFRPGGPLRQEQYTDARQKIFDEIRDHVISQLVLINIGILVSAGCLSYYLARRTLQPIEEAHEAQSRFTADASHELRTPITAMKTEIEVTLSDPKLSLKEAKEQLVSNLEELDTLTTLTEALLRLSQLDASDLARSRQLVAQLVNTAIDRIQPLAAKKRIELQSRVDEKLAVTVDSASLVEALVTILDNAIKYSPSKSTVSITGKAHRQSLQIIIADKGPGIKASELPHIFDRFYRADSSRTKSSTKGYGLGLAIAKNIVEQHGGSITAKSTVGKGTRLTITLPKA